MKFRRSLLLMAWPMTFLGLNPLKPDTFGQCYVRLLLCYGSIVYGACGILLFSYYSESNFYNISIPVSYAAVIFVHFFDLLYLQMKKHIMRDLLLNINENIFKYYNEEDFDYEPQLDRIQEEYFLKLHKLIVKYYIGVFAFFGMTPTFGYLLTDEWRTLFYPQYIPWQRDSVIAILLAYVQQIPISLYVLVVFFMITNYYVFILVEFDRQFGRLEYAIETLHERTSRARNLLLAKRTWRDLPLVSTDYADYSNKLFRRNLVMCIRHHQEIYKMYKKFNIFFKIDFEGQLLLAVSLTSVSLYGIIGEVDIERFMTLNSVMIMVLFNMFVRCFVESEDSECFILQNELASTECRK